MDFVLTSYGLLILIATVIYFIIIRRRNPLPPGPPGDPIIGHLRKMPTSKTGHVFHEWAKIYGDVMHLDVLGQSMIILDTKEAAVELLHKRSLNYSDRPKFTLYEAMGWTDALPGMRYGKQFGKHRQLHHNFLNRQKCRGYIQIQVQEAQTLARNLISSAPDRYQSFLSRFSSSIICQVVAGHRITTDDDPYLRLSKMVLETMGRTGAPGGSPVDFFPILRHFPAWFPGAYYAGFARKWKPMIREVYEYPVRCVRDQKEPVPSFIRTQLEELEDGAGELGHDDITGAAGTMFSAGESTTWSALTVFVLAMVLHPEYQAKAQKELDSVLNNSPGRLPSFEDRDDLPLVESIFQETLRWNPPVELGLPHRSMEEDVYRGMRIPKGSIVVANIRGMSLNENVYTNPEVFYPERFLAKPHGYGEPHFEPVFGFGRRICTGRYLAENSLWIAIATILVTCTISNAVDEHGEIIVPENSMSDGLTSHPKDFQCAITPRSAHFEALVMEATRTA